MGKTMKKIHEHYLGPWARGTGPKHGYKELKNKMFFKFHENFILGSLKYSKYGKNNEKNQSLLFRPVTAWDWAKIWLRHHVLRAHGPE